MMMRRQVTRTLESDEFNLAVCVFITVRPVTKLFAWGEGDSGGHVLRETTSRGLCGLVCLSRTSEREGEGYCVKDGVGGEGEREKERRVCLFLQYLLQTCSRGACTGAATMPQPSTLRLILNAMLLDFGGLIFLVT